jgi:YD repeat-containing protein
VSDPTGINASTGARYDAFGRLIASIDANGKPSQQSYDRLGRVVQTVDRSGASRSSTYDAFGRTLTHTNALDQTTTYTYSTSERKLTVTSPEGISVSTVHTRHGQTDTVTDGRNQTTRYEYDRNGKLVGTVTPLTSTSQSFDRAGRLLETTDARGNKVAYTYDAANRVLSVTTDPGNLHLTTRYRYDAKGQAVWSQDQNGVWTQTEYDLDGQVKAVTVDPKRGPDWAAGPDDNPGGLALRTAYTYDARGHQLTVTSPSGTLTRYTYDQLGRRSTEQLDPTGLNLTRSYTYDDNGNVVTSTDGNGQLTRYAYDDEGRLLFSVDAAGGVSRNDHDDEGRLVRSTRYANALAPASLASLPVPATAGDILARIVAAPGRDAIDARRYDRDNRLRFMVDGTGAVVELRYDASGNVTERIAYANAIDVAAWSGTSDPAVEADAGRDRRTRTVYDALGRATFVADATGAVTQYVHDDNGNVLRRIQHAAPIGAGISPDAVATGPGDRISEFRYDAANRLTWQADPTGAVSRTEYDDNGNVTRVTRHANLVGAGAEPSGVAANPAADRVTRLLYDHANRVVHSTDAEGYVTTTAYDTAARTTTTTRHFNQPAAPGGQPAPNDADQITILAYDAAGRLRSSTDALGHTETTTYDGLGNKLTFTNKKGSVWTYTYDAAGRLETETSPVVTLASLAEAGNGRLTGGASVEAAIVTRFAYDALGNLTSRTEAYGRPEQRTTSYGYDAAGRQIKVEFPPEYHYAENSFFDSQTGAIVPGHWVLRALSTRTFYDAFGDAVANVDVAGNASYRRYDAAGRVAYAVDAMGYVTGYARNAFGEVETLTRYSSATELADGVPTSAAQAPTAAQIVAALGSDRSADRTLSTTYDKLGRTLEVTESAAFSYDSSPGAGAPETAAKVTRSRYNAFGDLVQQAVSKGLADGAYTWSYSARYHDRLGQQTAEIDAAGHLTERRYDAVGNMTRVAEYARAVAKPTEGSWRTPVQAVASNDDRITEYVYDDGNRKFEERRLGVEYSTAAEAAAGQSDRRAVVTSYGYDALGNLTRTTDANDGNTYSYYDALGRVTAVAAPTRSSTVDGTALTPLTIFRRDAYGNVLTRLDLARGAAEAAEFTGVSRSTQTGYPAIVADTQDRFTHTRYDHRGHATQVTEATGVSRYATYNERGDVSQSWQLLTSGTPFYDADGSLIADSLRWTTYQYDKLGQLTHTIEPGPTGSLQAGLAQPKVTSSALVTVGTESNTHLALSGTNSVELQWTNLIDLTPGSGDVRVQIGYQTVSTQMMVTPGGYDSEGGGWIPPTYSGTASHGASRTWSDLDANTVGGGITLSWTDTLNTDGGISRLDTIVVSQLVDGAWVTRWQGTPAQANGDNIVLAAQAGAGVIDTVQTYNAFGEVVRRGVVDGSQTSGAQEYFEYDNAGRLWKTNAGDGVDKVMLYDLQGRMTALISSSGSGRADLSMAALSSQQAAELATARRTDFVYDAIGHLVLQRDPARLVEENGLTVRRLAAGFSTAGSNVPMVIGNTESGPIVGWSGASNRVNATWSDLSEMGSGEVRVTVSYRTVSYETSPAIPPMGEDPGSPAVVHASVARTFSTILGSTSAATGATLTWNDGFSSDGGISAITNLRVEKRDAQGQWVIVVDRPTPGTYGTALEVATPNDGLAGVVSLQIRPQSPPNGAWQNAGVDFGDALRLDFSELSGTWEYRVVRTAPDQAAPQQIGDIGTITAGMGETIVPERSAYRRPEIHQEVDRWGNVTERSDARNAAWVTRYRYNANNQLVELTQPVADTEVGAPVTRTFYDRLGQQLAVQDARGNINRQQFDAGGNLVQETHADGGIVTHRYDAFGNRLSTTDAIGNHDAAQRADHTTTYTYDKAGRLLTTTHGAVDVYGNSVVPDDGGQGLVTNFLGRRNLVESNTYDQAGRKISNTNGAGETTRYRYDMAGHVIETIDALQQSTKAAYDRLGRKVVEIDANGFASTWSYDYHKLTGHTDLGGARYRYTYDSAQQLTYQSNTRGQSLAFGYDAAGQQITISDYDLDQETRYEYDLAGRRVREFVRQGGNRTVYQDNLLAYDALGRLRDVRDGRLQLSIEYDAVGNRTRIRSRVDVLDAAGVTTGTPQESDRFYKYNAMNQQIVVDGIGARDQTGALLRDANGDYLVTTSLTQGKEVTYDLNGNRTSETKGGRRVVVTGGVVPGFYAYVGATEGGGRYYVLDGEGSRRIFSEAEIGYDNGRPYLIPLSGTDSEGGYPTYYYVDGIEAGPTYDDTTRYGSVVDTVTDTYDYDAMGRLSAIRHDGVTVDTRYYDAAGRTVRRGTGNEVARQYMDLLDSADDDVPDSGLNRFTELNVFDAAGRLTRQRIYSTLVKPSLFSGPTPLLGAPARYDFHRYKGTDYQYDAVGNVQSFTYEQRGDFINFYKYGTYLRFEGYAAGSIVGTSTELSGRSTSHAYDKNGHLVSYNNAGITRQLVNDAAGQVLYSLESGQAQRHIVVNGEVLGRYGLDDSEQVADFNFVYEALGGDTPGSSVGSYTVRPGDTLRGIARAVYGDATLWYLLADANGLAGEGDLSAGQVLSLPPRAPGARNNAQTVKPYDTSRIKGDTTPQLAAPEGDCGGAGRIIVMIVAIVVTVLVTIATDGAGTDGTLRTFAAILKSAAALEAPAIGAVVTGAVAGNVAGQLTGMALGIQSEFDWKSVALSAISSAVSVGLPTTGLLEDTIVRAAVANATTQGIAVVTGLQEKFDWRGVAAAAAGTAAGVATGKMLDALGVGGAAIKAAEEWRGLQTFARAGLQGFAAGLVTAAARGGKVSVTQVAVDVFGNALGSSIARGITSEASQQEATSPTYNDGDISRSELRYATGPISNETRTTAEALHGALVGMMGQEPEPRDSANDVLVADSSRLSLSNRGDTSTEMAISNRKAWIDTIDRLQRQNAMLAGGIAAVQDFKAGTGHGGSGSGTGPRGRGELSASYAYQQGWGDIRETVTPMPVSSYAGYADDHFAGEFLPSAAQTPTYAPMTMDWFEPGLVGGLGAGVGVPNLSVATPSPSTFVLPVNNGYWTNPAQPGNSGWRSTLPGVNAVTGGRAVPFRNGMANFSPWSQGEVFVPNMTGREIGPGNDLQLGRNALREKYGLSSDTAVKQWLKQQGLTLHHAADGVRLELIPSSLHNTTKTGGIPHAGGASILRNWDYSQGTPMQFYNANRIAAGARYVGAAGMAYGAYADASSLYGEYQISQQSGNYANTINEATRVAGGWTGAWAVGAAGAQFGAGFGSVFGPVGTVVGGIAGGAIGGLLGYAGGSYAAPRVVYDIKSLF